MKGTKNMLSLKNGKRFMKNRRGFGHFVAIGLGVAASLVLFSVIWPDASSMMKNEGTSMTTMDNNMMNQLNNNSITG